MKTPRHIPLFNYADFEDFNSHRPHDCQLVGVELDEKAVLLEEFKHPERAIYLLGAEDHGLPREVLGKCQSLIRLRGEFSMNVAVAGSLVMYHRTS
jgi:tRNA G18 (ribose-2'-O)-methylase SpoU